MGFLGLFMPDVFGGDDFIDAYKLLAQLFLFGFTAFQVLKRVFFYKVKGNINIIKLVKTSDAQIRLLVQGVVITLLFLAYIKFYGNLMDFDTIMIGILLFYYGTQVLEHGRPSIYIDDYAFSYDDYFVKQWPWASLEHIEFEEEELRLIGKDSDFELDFESIDDIDFVRLDDELERSILDGEFASSLTSNDLVGIIKNHAKANEVNIRAVVEE
ncbi:MAG: hypothetical protein ACI9XB_000834 [Gammaproteobacteria bacterium]|jgi:hypothetical protein